MTDQAWNADATQSSLLLNRYRIETLLGEGGLGTVYRAFDTRLKRLVAIKTLKRSIGASDPEYMRSLEERFVREAEAGSRMGSHPNLVTVHDLVTDSDGTLNLILEYVAGGTLAEKIANRPIPFLMPCASPPMPPAGCGQRTRRDSCIGTSSRRISSSPRMGVLRSAISASRRSSIFLHVRALPPVTLGRHSI